jgi:hypothetical protein
MLVIGSGDLPVCKVNDSKISFVDNGKVGNEVYNLEESDKITLNTVAPARQRHCFFVIGASGAGKTYFCAQYARAYLKEHDDTYHVVLVCGDKDIVFDGMPRFLHLTPSEIMAKDIGVADLARCLIIFDDIGSITNKQEAAAVNGLANECLERSRKFEGDIMFISHAGSNYKATKTISIECNFVWFNLDGMNSNLLYTLKKFGISKDAVLKFVEHKEKFGRWIVFRVNSSPSYIVSPLRVAMFDELKASI